MISDEMVYGPLSAITRGSVDSAFVHRRFQMKLSGIADTGALRIFNIYGLYIVICCMIVVSYRSARMQFCATVIRKR